MERKPAVPDRLGSAACVLRPECRTRRGGGDVQRRSRPCVPAAAARTGTATSFSRVLIVTRKDRATSWAQDRPLHGVERRCRRPFRPWRSIPIRRHAQVRLRSSGEVTVEQMRRSVGHLEKDGGRLGRSTWRADSRSRAPHRWGRPVNRGPSSSGSAAWDRAGARRPPDRPLRKAAPAPARTRAARTIHAASTGGASAVRA